VFADPVSGSQDHFKKPGWLRKIVLKYLELTICGPLERTTPKQYLEELKGIADGADIDYPTIFIANFLSDFNMSMIPGVIKGQAAKFEEMLSCSSFVATGTATSDGRLVFGVCEKLLVRQHLIEYFILCEGKSQLESLCAYER
jgi:hypothetical protein